MKLWDLVLETGKSQQHHNTITLGGLEGMHFELLVLHVLSYVFMSLDAVSIVLDNFSIWTLIWMLS